MNPAMMTLYGLSGSRSTRVLWTLEELGLPYQYVAADLRHGRAGNRPLSALNPGMKVPVLQDGDLLLTESMAICLYLAELDQERRLLPDPSPRQQARLLQWCSFAVTELEQPLWTYAKHTFALPKQWRVAGMDETARYEFSVALGVLETGLPQDAYILGEQFTVADILIGNTLAWASSTGWLTGSHSLSTYLERLQGRPALARAHERETADAA
jgi:glutathione S-transferase